MAFPQVGLEAVMSMAGFKAGMDQYNSSIDEMIGASQRAATEAGGALDSFVSRATDGAMEAAVVFGGLGATIAAFATKAVFTAARIEELEIVLALVGKTAGYTNEAVFDMVAALEDQGIAGTAAREGVLRVMQAQLDLGGALELAKAAQDLAIVGQQESTKTFEDFIKATVTGNTIILRKYGIMDTGIMMYKDYAEQLGITTGELTQTQKQEAIMQGILEAGLSVQGAYNEAMKTASKNYRSLPRLVEDVVKAFGDGLLPVFEDVIFTVKDILTTLGDLDEQTWETISRVAGFAAVMATAVGAAGGLVFAIPKIVAALTFLTGPLGLAAAAVGALAYAFVTDFGGIRDVVSGVWDAIEPIIETLTRVIGNLIRAFTEGGLPEALAYWKKIWPEFSTYLRGVLLDIVLEAKDRVGELARVLVDWIAPKIPEILEKLGELGSKVVGWIIEQAPVLAAQLVDWGKAFVDWVSPYASELISKLSTLATEIIGLVGEQIYDVIDQVFGGRVADIIATFVGDVTRGLSAIQDAFGAEGVRGAIEEFGEQVYGVIEKVFGTGVADMVADFVEDVQRGLSNIEDAFEERGIVGAVKELGRQIFGVIEDVFGTDIADAVAEFVENTRDFLEDVKDAFEEGGIVGAIKEVGIQIYNSIEEAFGAETADLIAEFADNTREFIENIVAGFQEGGVPGAIEAFGVEIYKSIEEAFGTETADLIADFTQGVEEDLGELKTAFDTGGVPALVEDFAKKFKEGLDILLDTKVSNDIEAFVAGVIEDIEELKTAFDVGGLPALVGEFAEKLLEGINIIFDREWAAEQIGGFVEGVLTDLADLADAFKEEGITGALEEFGKKFDEGMDIIFDTNAANVVQRKEFLDGIYADLDEIARAFEREGVTGALEVFGKKFEEGFDIIFGEGNLNKITTFLTGVAADLVDLAIAFRTEGVTGALTEFGTKFNEGMQIIIDATLGKFFNLVGDIAGKFVEGVVEFGDKIATAAITFVNAFTQGLVDAIMNLGPKTSELLSTFAHALIEALKRALMGSPEYATYYIALDFMRDFVKGLGAGGAEVSAEGAAEVARAISTVMRAITDALAGLGALGEADIPGAGDIAARVEALMASVKVVIQALLQVAWDFEAMGHDWLTAERIAAKVAGYISTAVGWIGRGVESLNALKDYVSPAKASVDAFMADIQTIMGKLMEIATGEVDQVKLAWVEFAGKMISFVAGMIDDLAMLAGFTGGLTANAANVINLVETMDSVANTILTAISTVTSDFQASDSVDQLKAAWLEFSAGLISTVAGMIDDLAKLAALEGGLDIALPLIQGLIAAIQAVVNTIQDMMDWMRDTPLYDFTFEIEQWQQDWLDFAAGLIAVVAGVIADLQTLSAFEGKLNIAPLLIQGLLGVLAATVHVISDMMDWMRDTPLLDFAFEAEQWQQDWLDFAAGLISTLANVIEDLETLAAFKGGLGVNATAVANLVAAMGDAVDAILLELGDLEAFDEDAMAAAQLFAETAGAVLDALGKGMEVFAQGMPEIGEGIEEGIGEFARLIGLAVKEFKEEAAKFDKDILAITKDFAETASSVLDALGTAMEVFTVEFPALAESLEEDIGRFVEALSWAVEDFASEAENFDADMLAAAKDFAEAAGAAVDVIGAGIEGFALLPGFVSPGQQAIKDFAEALGDLVEEFGEVAADFEADALTHTQTFAEAAEAAVGIVGEGIEGLALLPGFVTPGQRAMKDFAEAVGDLVEEFRLVGERFTKDMLADAKDFADAADSVVGLIKDAVEAFDAVRGYSRVPLVAIQKLAKDIDLAVKEMVALAKKFDKDALKAAKAFAEDAQSVFEFLEQAASTFEKMGKLEKVPVKAMEKLKRGIEEVIRIMQEMARDADRELLQSAIDFAYLAEDAMAFVDTAIEFLVTVSEYGGVDIPWQALRDDIIDLLGFLGEIVSGLDSGAESVVGLYDDALSIVENVNDGIAEIGAVVSISDEVLLSWSVTRGNVATVMSAAVTIGDSIADGVVAIGETLVIDAAFIVSEVNGAVNRMGAVVGIDSVALSTWADLDVGVDDIKTVVGNINIALGTMYDQSGDFWADADYIVAQVGYGVTALLGVNQAAGLADEWAAVNVQISGGVMGYGVKQYMQAIVDATAGATTMGTVEYNALAFKIAAANINLAVIAGVQSLESAAGAAQAANLPEGFAGLQGDVDALLEAAGYTPGGGMALGAMGYDQVCEFAEGIEKATSDCVAPAFEALVRAVMSGVADVNAELDNLGVSSPKFQSLHELNAELLQTAAIAATALRTISLAAERRGGVLWGMGGGTTYYQTFNVSPTVSGNTFMIREEADIGRVTEATLEAMREGLGDFVSRRERY